MKLKNHPAINGEKYQNSWNEWKDNKYLKWRWIKKESFDRKSVDIDHLPGFHLADCYILEYFCHMDHRNSFLLLE